MGVTKPCDRCKLPTDGVYKHEDWVDNRPALFNGYRETVVTRDTIRSGRFSRLRYRDRIVESNTYTDLHLCPSCWDGLTDYIFPSRQK